LLKTLSLQERSRNAFCKVISVRLTAPAEANDDFERGGLGHHPPQPVRQPGRVGIVLHPALQVARLADIERVALAIEHAVDAGAARHMAQCRPQHLHPAGDADRMADARRRLARHGPLRNPGRGVRRQAVRAAPRVARRGLPASPRPLRRRRRVSRLNCHRIFGSLGHIHGMWG
jgi:hypothetical protein